MTCRALHALCLICVLLLLTACGEETPTISAQRGSPDAAAIEFFHALYNDKDLDKAKTLCTDEYAALLESYGTAKQVSRVLMNMSYDQVDIVVNPGGRNVRQQYGDEASISLVFSGTLHSKQIEEMRTVELLKQSGRWKINAVKADKFSSSVR